MVRLVNTCFDKFVSDPKMIRIINSQVDLAISISELYAGYVVVGTPDFGVSYYCFWAVEYGAHNLLLVYTIVL